MFTIVTATDSIWGFKQEIPQMLPRAYLNFMKRLFLRHYY